MSTSRVLAFCGFAGSGKNTAAEQVLHEQPAQRLAFADALKDAVAVIFQWDRRLLEGDTDLSRAWRERIDPVWSARLGRDITPRRVLQEVGTDVFRQHFHCDIWLAALEARLRDDTCHVITDARFGNEMQWIRNHDGAVVWVYRPTPVLDTVLPVSCLTDAPALQNERFASLRDQSTLHASETSFLTEGAALVDIVLVNTGTREMLSQLTEHARRVAENPSQWALPWRTTTLYLQSAGDPATFEWRYREHTTIQSVFYDRQHQNVGDGLTRMMYNTRRTEVSTYV